MEENNIDLLKKVEDLTAQLNQAFREQGRNVFNRYPLLFALLILFGVTLIIQGAKDLLMLIPFFEDKPFVMLGIGLLLLIFTGTLYKKLKK